MFLCNEIPVNSDYINEGLQKQGKGDDKLQDKNIIELFFQREEKAINEAEKVYGSYCRKIISNILKDPEDIEECSNDTFNKLWNSIPPTNPGYLKAFIGKIARNTALDKLNYNKALKRNGEFDVLISELADYADCISLENEIQARFIVRKMSDFLRSEKEETRNIFIRRYWYGDSIADIAKHFSLSESKVKSVLSRTRSKMKSYLKKEADYEQS